MDINDKNANLTPETEAAGVEKKPAKQRRLLYDPMFDPKMKEAAVRRGKNTPMKIIFTAVILVFIGISLYFSFRSVAQDRYVFTDLDDGTVRLDLFNGQEADRVLKIDFKVKDDGSADTSHPVTEIKAYAVTCNEYLRFIWLGKDVRTLDARSFFSCKNLMGILIDPENPYFTVIDGVLYQLEDGIPTRCLLSPAKRGCLLSAQKAGAPEVLTTDDAQAFSDWLDEHQDEADKAYNDVSEDGSDRFTYTVKLPETVTVIGQMAFAYAERISEVEMPDGLTEIEPMGLFRCSDLTSLDLPDSVVVIGSDAFSYASGIKDIFIPAGVRKIGHHAFFNDGAETVRMELSKDEVKELVELGDGWAPKVRKVFKVQVPIEYSQRREASVNG